MAETPTISQRQVGHSRLTTAYTLHTLLWRTVHFSSSGSALCHRHYTPLCLAPAKSKVWSKDHLPDFGFGITGIIADFPVTVNKSNRWAKKKPPVMTAPTVLPPNLFTETHCR